MKLWESAKNLIGLCAKIRHFKPGVQTSQFCFVWKFILVAFEQRDGIECSHGLPNQLGRVGALFILHLSITMVNYVGFSDFGIEHYVIH